MQIIENYDLTNLNTFGIKVKAKFFALLEKEEDFLGLLKREEFIKNEKLFLGGGSNILFTKDFDGIVILNRLKGIEVKENGDDVLVESMSGENWDDLVAFCVNKGYSGIENLSGIPGTVGAAPVQNIGAYGVELKDSLYKVEVYDIHTGEKRFFLNSECEFSYRESIFKNKLKGKYFISKIILRLNKNWNKKIEYKTLKDYIEKNDISIESLKELSEIIRKIRKDRLPDPKVLGNSGSFFKNVFISPAKLEELKKQYPEIPYFIEGDEIKIPSGWLIEQCGWKRKKEKNVSVYEKQALVLVNLGGASGEDIENFAKNIIESVYQKFGLKISPEVNLF